MKKRVVMMVLILLVLFSLGGISHAKSAQTNRALEELAYGSPKSEVMNQFGESYNTYEDKQQIIKELTKKYNPDDKNEGQSSILAQDNDSGELLEDLTSKDSVEVLKYYVTHNQVLTCIFGDNRLVFAHLGEDIFFN